MNRDDIIRMAREAGLVLGYPFTWENLERFAALVAAAEQKKVEEAYNRLSVLHTETMAELIQTQQMLWARLNLWQTFKAWVKHTFRKYK